MREEKIEYDVEGVLCIGHAVFPKEKGPMPVVMIAHAWMGQDLFARNVALEMAKNGYIGFAIDIYGQGTTAQNSERAQELMMPLFLDRELLQKRLNGALNAAIELKGADPENVAAIGFCFGGLSVIELLRSGAKVKGAVSIHGVIANSLGGHKAKTRPLAEEIKGALLVLHGHDDPLVSPSDLTEFEAELTKGGVDWQLHVFGHTSHAFTNPEAHDKASGLVYSEKSNRRTWPLVECFLKEVFTEQK